MDEEMIGQRRELGGGRVGICDLCGNSSNQLSLMSLDGTSRLGETDQPINVCSDCAEQLARGEFPVDPDELEPSD